MGIIKPGGIMRYLDPDIFCDEWFGNLDPQAKQLWIGLIINLSDDQGRLINNPSLIRIRIYPFDKTITDSSIRNIINKFVKAKKLISYSSGLNGSTKNYLQIRNFWNYQKLAQWAGPSDYPAPDGWEDRLRYHAKGENNIKMVNWGPIKPYEVPTQVPTQVPTPVPTQVPTEVGYRDVNVNDDVNIPNHPIKGTNKKAVGLGDGKKIKELSGSNKEKADKIKRILTVSGMLPQKAINISVDMAIRSLDVNLLLASLASCYADPTIKNISSVAIWRIENNCIPGKFSKSETWKILPKEILEIAGIKDIRKKILQDQLTKFLG
jgi:hypothetical protein